MITAMAELLTGNQLAERVELALAVPLQAALGAALLDPRDPAAGVRFTVTGLALNGAGGAHAAALAAVLELAGYLALLPQLTGSEHALTHSAALQLAAPAAAGQDVEATGTLDRRSRRLAFVSVTATCQGQLVARAQLVKSIVAIQPVTG